MSSTHFDVPQDYDQQHALSPTQKSAIVGHVHDLLANLGITSYPDSEACDSYTDKYQPLEAPCSVPQKYNTNTKPPAHLSTEGHIPVELDTTDAHHIPPTPRSTHITTDSSDELCPQAPDEFSDQLTYDKELTRMAALKAQMRISASKIAQARYFVDVETDILRDLEAEFLAIQCGRQHKGRGGTYNRTNTSHADTSASANQGSQSSNVKLPFFMARYMPPPDATVHPPNDPQGTKRCTIGRPLGRILRPSDGRFYNIGRCDKHEDQNVFHDNMNEHMGREGNYRLNDHAWKCSGEATRGPRREASHRM